MMEKARKNDEESVTIFLSQNPYKTTDPNNTWLDQHLKEYLDQNVDFRF